MNLLKTKDMENMGKAIEEIGPAKTCITEPVIKEAKRIVMEKGLDAAELYAAQLTATDENTEMMRVFKISRKYNLPPEAIAQVLDKLEVIESGKW
jgi:alanyl-tRNA synthetase